LAFCYSSLKVSINMEKLAQQVTNKHLFLHCSYDNNIWQWFGSLLNTPCSFSSISEALDLCKKNWPHKCKMVIFADVINCFNIIWFCRNQVRFVDNKINHRSIINLIITNNALCGNHSKLLGNSSIKDFVILKAFSIQITYRNAPKIKQVIWKPPIFNWVKCNIDGASNGNVLGCTEFLIR